MAHETHIDHPRGQWPRLLGALSPERVTARANEIAAPYRIEQLQLPESGLALLRMREGCFGEHFNLCEVPLAEVCIELVDSNGDRAKGGARVLNSTTEYAQAVAVLDALLAARWPGWEVAQKLLDEGWQEVQRTEAARAEIRERTRVDFSVLSAMGGEDDDN
jgi:alpha-D-ribose 1-methylphosphonate 5-triphosphate synthase subunit PhnG